MKLLIGAAVGAAALTLAVPAPAMASPAHHDRGTGYTLAQVAAHSTAADCWTVVGRGVYDGGKWLTANPTTTLTAATICGKDATLAFKTAQQTLNASRPHDDDEDEATEHLGSQGDHRGGRGDHRVRAASVKLTDSDHGDRGHHYGSSLFYSLRPYRIGYLVTTSTTTPPPVTPPVTTPPVTTPPPVTPPPATVLNMTEVAKHNAIGNCWTVISGTVYDLSNFNHAGGADKIQPVCGKDGTSTFTGQHGNIGSSSASSHLSVIAPFAKGPLVP